MRPERVVVIGAGVGGSAAALLLADAGLRVTLVDKNPRVGGSCSWYPRHGFHVDLGTHMFSRGDRGPLGEVLRRVGEGGAIRFRRTPVIAQVRVVGGSERIHLDVPAAGWRLPAFAWSAARALGLSPSESARAAQLFAHILSMHPVEVAALDDVTVEDFLAAFGAPPSVTALFGLLLGLYFVVPYWQASAGEALWCFRRMARDNALSYPVGGSVAVPGTYCRLAQARGAVVRTRAGVSRILVEGGRVTGVELESGERLEADVVISTSSVRTTLLRLVGEAHLDGGTVAAARAIRGSAVAVQVKIGLPRRHVDVGAIVGGAGEGPALSTLSADSMRRLMSDVEEGKVPEAVPFYCPVPTEFDPGLAPVGHQLLTACSLAPTTNVRLVDPAPAWEKAMLGALSQAVPGVLDDAVFVDTFSVGFLERWIGKEHGPAISTAQVPGQVGRRRPPVTTPIDGLYVAGCGAGGRGVGTELAATSAMEAVGHVLGRVERARRRRRERVALWGLAPVRWATRPRVPAP